MFLDADLSDQASMAATFSEENVRGRVFIIMNYRKDTFLSHINWAIH
jgi:hypothetical protein